MTSTEQTQVDWWRGVAELLAHGLAHGARKAQRAHISIADETFNILARIPLTRPVSEPVRSVHHGIAGLSYGVVATLATGLALVCEQEGSTGRS
ncbi:hypothetical protein [Marinobacter sp. SS21]|uniref:hypothetical protein n=1 Tax=Marinobacter sp. SS21 TaxID=2979460 RepID=UPI00232C7DC5|nr:hypothetical protein [Marinobacter sp. SS21]MDC0662930.1 hypothetical protein [Marinobacter sp. SS21]